MSNFFDALKLVKEVKPVKIEYRLYYDGEGLPLFYTMQEEKGDYITVTKEEFAECRYDVIIVDGKLTKVNGLSIGKLVPSANGFGTLKNDVSIVSNEQKWRLKTYEND